MHLQSALEYLMPRPFPRFAIVARKPCSPRVRGLIEEQVRPNAGRRELAGVLVKTGEAFLKVVRQACFLSRH